MACFFVFLTVLYEKKFKILMDLIWADVSTEFEASPFWLFLLLDSLLTFQQLWWPWTRSSGCSDQRSTVWHRVTLCGYYCPGLKSSSPARRQHPIPQVKDSVPWDAQATNRCQRPGVGPQVTHNFCLTLLQIRGIHDHLPSVCNNFQEPLTGLREAHLPIY